MTAALRLTTTDTTATSGLAARTMNVSLSLSAFTGKRQNRKVTTEVLEEKKADADGGRWETALVPKKSLDAVNSANSHARARHYALTLPWGDENLRILSAAAFFDYMSAMDEERTKCEAAYGAFIANYPTLLAEAPTRLANLYRAADFPTVEEIKSKFGFRLVVLPVSDSNDFRVSLGQEAEQEIRRSIEETVTERYAEAQRELWTRLMDTVKHFAETMQQEKKVFRDSTVTKLADLARLAPKLSLTPDPRLEEMCAEVLRMTRGVTPNDLREHKGLRTDTARKAREALAKIERSMEGAF